MSYIFLFDIVRIQVFHLSKNRTENRFPVPVRVVNRVPVHKTAHNGHQFLFQVSNLFAKDELDEITNELIAPMKKDFPKWPPTPETLYNYFISRARKNLHVVLCFSPVRKLSCFLLL